MQKKTQPIKIRYLTEKEIIKFCSAKPLNKVWADTLRNKYTHIATLRNKNTFLHYPKIDELPDYWTV